VDTLARARQKSLPCEGSQPSLVVVNYTSSGFLGREAASRNHRLEKREIFLWEVREAFSTAWL